MIFLSRLRVEQLLDGFAGKTVLVLGDVMLDEFIWGKVRRISPEAPVPVVEVVEETYRLGGAGNVAANVRALDGNPIPIGVVGRDPAADRVSTLLEGLGIDSANLFRDDRPTTLKTRIIAHSQQVVRTDREEKKPIVAEVNVQLAGSFLRWLSQSHVVVVSDYDKGIVNRDLLSKILPEAKRRGVPVFLDPKVHHADYYRPITLITPNQGEAELLAGLPIEGEATLEEAGRRLLARFQCSHVLITRGEDGMSLFDNEGAHHLPTFAREVFDVTGAGDTVIATLALARAAGAAMEEAAILANHAAGIVVGKVGTATTSRSELLRDFDDRHAHRSG